MELPVGAVNTEGCGVRTTERIGQGITRIGICRSNGTADVLTRTGILRDSARRATAIREHWGPILVDICDVDPNINGVCEFTIRDGDSHGVKGLGFII